MTGRLDELVAKINKAFEQVDAGRIRAGKLLLEAKSLVAPGHWRTWCESNVRRSFRDIQRLVAIAASPDPVAALEQARAATRGYVATHRQQGDLRKSPPELPLRSPRSPAGEHSLYVFDGVADTNVTIPTGADAEAVAIFATAVAPPEPRVRIHGEFWTGDEDDPCVQVAPGDPRATSWEVSVWDGEWCPESDHDNLIDAAKAALAILSAAAEPE